MGAGADARQLGFRVLALGGFVVLAAITTLGVLQAYGLAGDTFSLDAELIGGAYWSYVPSVSVAIPVLVSGVLLLVAAGLAWRARLGWPTLVLGTLFLLMAIDDLYALHERLAFATGIDWQHLYAPIAVLAGVAGLLAMRRLPTGLGRSLLAAGAAAWLVAMLLEALQWHPDGPVSAYTEMMLIEETLEGLGSLMFGLAFAAPARVAAAAQAAAPSTAGLARPARPAPADPARRSLPAPTLSR